MLAALFVIYGQFFSGRYQDLAQSEELRAELGRLAAEAGAEFERHVGAAFDAADRFEVKTSVAASSNLERAERELLEFAGGCAHAAEEPCSWPGRCSRVNETGEAPSLG